MAGLFGKSILKLVARGNRAFREFMPIRETQAEAGRIYRKIAYGPLLDVFMLDMRSYRAANANGDIRPVIFGATQLAWLKRELAQSQATWKLIAADLPIGVVSHDAIAQGDGPPHGRELESPICCHSSSMPASTIPYGSPPTCTTPRPTSTIPTRRSSRTSTRSGSSYRARSTPAPGSRAGSTTPSVRARSIRWVQQGAARQSCALLRSAILRSRGDRRRDRGDDGDAQGRQRPVALVESDRAEMLQHRVHGYVARGPDVLRSSSAARLELLR